MTNDDGQTSWGLLIDLHSGVESKVKDELVKDVTFVVQLQNMKLVFRNVVKF
jgi:hypothetical protein